MAPIYAWYDGKNNDELEAQIEAALPGTVYQEKSWSQEQGTKLTYLGPNSGMEQQLLQDASVEGVRFEWDANRAPWVSEGQPGEHTQGA